MAITEDGRREPPVLLTVRETDFRAAPVDLPPMQLTLYYGQEVQHKAHGLCRFIAPHPDDGACLIMYRWDDEKDEAHYFECEREDLL